MRTKSKSSQNELELSAAGVSSSTLGRWPILNVSGAVDDGVVASVSRGAEGVVVVEARDRGARDRVHRRVSRPHATNERATRSHAKAHRRLLSFLFDGAYEMDGQIN